MRQRQSYIVRKIDLTKLRRYSISTECAICKKDIQVGDKIRRTRGNTYHFKCYNGTLM